jgi:hypothetical protein
VASRLEVHLVGLARLLVHLTVVEANTVASDPESKGRPPFYSKSLLAAEPAAEFNDTRGFQSFDEPHKFRAGEVSKLQH